MQRDRFALKIVRIFKVSLALAAADVQSVSRPTIHRTSTSIKLSYSLLSPAMQFLPEDTLTITTSLDGSTIKQRFTNLIVPQQTGRLRLHQQATVYRGNVIGNDLEFFRPARLSQNRYAPFVRGKIA